MTFLASLNTEDEQRFQSLGNEGRWECLAYGLIDGRGYMLLWVMVLKTSCSQHH